MERGSRRAQGRARPQENGGLRPRLEPCPGRIDEQI